LIGLSKEYLRVGFLCYYCKTKMSIGIANSPDTCTVDHCISIGKGGDNTINNLVLCCEDCNRKKGGRKYDKQNENRN
jgi:5-methylcytosine-specific restriction endonuclease McrA